MSDDNFERFTNCAVEVLSVDASKITREASFADDLDADSLDLVELVMALEEEFGVSAAAPVAVALMDLSQLLPVLKSRDLLILEQLKPRKQLALLLVLN